MANAGALRHGWRAASLASSWSGTANWWTSAVDAVSDALVRLGDVRAAGEALGRQRAEAGVYLDEARADIRVAARIAALNPARTADLVDALTVGWVDRTLHEVYTAPCADALTELASPQYLSTRLAEVWAEARLVGEPVERTHVLVIVQPDAVRDPIGGETQMITVQTALRFAFPGGETLARMGPHCAAALAFRAPGRLHESLAVLRVELEVAMTERRLPRTRTWLEAVPRDADALAMLLRDLAS